MVSIALAKDFEATISYEGDGRETIEGMQGGIEECLREIEKVNPNKHMQSDKVPATPSLCR